MRTRRAAWIATGALLLALALSACAYAQIAELDTFAAVDAIAEELDVESSGTTNSIEYSGTKSGTAQPPTLHIQIRGDDVVANLEARLEDAGFEAQAGNQDSTIHTWERGDELVFVKPLPRDGVVLLISAYPQR